MKSHETAFHVINCHVPVCHAVVPSRKWTMWLFRYVIVISYKCSITSTEVAPIVHLMKLIPNPTPWIHISQGTHHPNPDPGQERHKLLVLLAARPSVVEHHKPPRTGLGLTHKQTFADNWLFNMIIVRDRRLLQCNHNCWYFLLACL